MGFKDGVHYVGWTDYADLGKKIAYWLDPKRDKMRRKIADAAQKFVRERHSFDARVRELVKLLPMARRVPDGFVELKYQNAREQFGVRGPVTTRQYVYTPGVALLMDKRDADALKRRDANWVDAPPRDESQLEGV